MECPLEWEDETAFNNVKENLGNTVYEDIIEHYNKKYLLVKSDAVHVIDNTNNGYILMDYQDDIILWSIYKGLLPVPENNES